LVIFGPSSFAKTGLHTLKMVCDVKSNGTFVLKKNWCSEKQTQ